MHFDMKKRQWMFVLDDMYIDSEERKHGCVLSYIMQFDLEKKRVELRFEVTFLIWRKKVVIRFKGPVF